MTKDQILFEMKNRSVTNGWDIVCAMSAERITSLFQDKYDKEKDQPCPPSGVRESGLPCRINLNYIAYDNEINVDVYLGPPLISFIPEDPKKCKCRFLITSGTFQSQNIHKARGNVSVLSADLNQVVGTDTLFTLQGIEGNYIKIGSEVAIVKSIIDDTHITVEEAFKNAYNSENYSILNGYEVIPSGPLDNNEYYIISIVPLGMIEGSVSNGHEVVIDFNSDDGNYVTDFVIAPAFSNGLSDALKQYFKNTLQKEKYSLGTLLYNENPELINLTPTDFRFATGVKSGDTTDKGCLMLFIKLVGGELGNNTYLTGVNGEINNPIPEGCTAALIISSKVFFKVVLLPQYQSQFNTNVYTVNESTLKDWKIKCTGNIDGGKIDSIQEQDILIPLDNFQICCEDDTIKVNWSEKWDQTVQYKRSVYSGGEAYEVISDGEIEVTISTENQNYTFSVTEPDEVLNCSSQPNMKVEVPKPSFWDGYGISHVKDAIQSTLNKSIEGILKIELKGVSIFAVSNLLFPQDNIITYKPDGVYTPGDLIIFGDTKSKL